jgi:eukaryotic-like serine/threonine-protein kinase
MRLRDLDPAQYAHLSALLDQSLELEPDARVAWLAQLAQHEPESATLLRELLATGAAAAAEPLVSPDTLLRELAAQEEGDAALIGKRFGPYRVLSLLGRGGMGSVWLAERVDGLFSRQVALKLVSAALLGKVVLERLAREREILGSLAHANIARLLDAGFAADGQPYLALEYVDGIPLTSYCDERRLGLHERLQLFRQVLSAVQYAHARLVIHRDLKPSNILVSADGQVHLLDFGIAKLLIEGEAKETQLTQLGGRALTPDYAAPEQILGAPITTAADVYALGVMLYELLTGERPYRLRRDSRGALEEAILEADPAAPSHASITEAAAQARAMSPARLAKALRGDLDTITLTALKKSPQERYPTVDAFGEDIGRYLSGDAVRAQRDSVAYRARKFVRRHWVGISVAGALVLTLAAGLAATSYEARLAARQRDAAIQAQLRSLTQTAAARLKDGDASGAMNIILEVLPRRPEARAYAPEALSVFQEAQAAEAQEIGVSGPADVWFVAFSPRGDRFVTATDDKLAHLYDAASGREQLLLRGHSGRVWSASFSPDGTRIVTASADKTARIWDASSGRVLRVLSGHGDAVESAMFSPDGRTVATASADRTAALWDAASGAQLRVFSGHTNRVIAIGFAPDGQRLATASTDSSARIWEAASGRLLMTLTHPSQVSSVAFSADGTHLLTGSDDRRAHVWDLRSGLQTLQLSGHTDPVVSVGYFPDGERAVTGSTDRTARVWDLGTGALLEVLRGHRDRVESVALSPDGRRLASASDDKTVRLWNLAMDPARVLTGHTDRVTFVSFSPDGHRVATSSDDNSARVWDAATGAELQRLKGHAGHVFCSVFSPDGLRLVTCGADNTARTWDIATGRELQRFTGHTDWVTAASFSPDGRELLTASFDGSARLWDSASARPLRDFKGHTDGLWFAAFAPDGRRIVTASRDRTARIWDSASARPLVVLSGHTDQIFSARFSGDGRRLVTASDDRTARVWDAASGRELQRLVGHGEGVVAASFSPDGHQIVTASTDKTARVWDADSGLQLRLFGGHTDHVSFAEFSPDGSSVVSSSDDFTARIWDPQTLPLALQVGWSQAAQFDPLPDTERYQLGLAQRADVPRWPADRSRCDTAAAAPYDPARHAAGVMLEQLPVDIALAACQEPMAEGPLAEARRRYQLGRARMAGGDIAAARQDLEAALAGGYGSARIELAMLLTRPGSSPPQVQRGLSLYREAWSDGLAIAGFELGTLYANGIAGAEPAPLSPDPGQALEWFKKAAAVGEPNALAQLAGRAEDASVTAATPERRNALLLEAFGDYAAAAEQAERADWPDDAWRAWRYRRASLAHLLAHAGMSRQVAETYQRISGG